MSGRWVRLIRPEPAHECRTPTPRLRDGVGSVWECKCGQRWRLTRNDLDGWWHRTSWSLMRSTEIP